jgi:hypothetical protein
MMVGLALFPVLTFPAVFAEDNTLSIQYQDQSYDVRTSLTNGVVNSMDLDPDFTSLILNVETNGGEQAGVLTVTLPRALIDARQGNLTNASDDKFIVVVGNTEVDYEETANSGDTERELKISVPSGTERIEIVGTQVVPEFHFAFMAVFFAFLIMIVCKIGKGEVHVR